MVIAVLTRNHVALIELLGLLPWTSALIPEINNAWMFVSDAVLNISSLRTIELNMMRNESNILKGMCRAVAATVHIAYRRTGATL